MMAEMGIRKFADLIGRVDLINPLKAVGHWKAHGVDVANILHMPDVPDSVAKHNVRKQDLSVDLDDALDHKLIELSQPSFENNHQVHHDMPIHNTNRAVGAMLSYEISCRFGEKGLPPDTIGFNFKGSAGQSFGAFLAPGVTFRLAGDANDYVGKGLSGGKIIICPPPESTIVPEDNIIVGNVVLYGATAGKVFIRGAGGERFGIRNSGCQAVIEHVGDHCCEYMTGGVIVVLGETGRNFAAGMSGGVAYVLDRENDFAIHCNKGMVDLVPVDEEEDIKLLKNLIEEHSLYTKSVAAQKILDDWDNTLPKFLKIYPRDYRRVLEERKARAEKGALEEVA